MSRLLHGTTLAEACHRRDGGWPCRDCVAVRADVERQLLRRSAHNPIGLTSQWLAEHWYWLTTEQRWEQLGACIEIARDVDGLMATTGMPEDLALALWLVREGVRIA